MGNVKKNGSSLIKSRKRVSDYGEVFTPEWLVKDMCDLIPEWRIDTTVLEPACGNGNFLAEILRRKFELCESADDALLALSTTYGVDIQEDNVEECIKRLYAMYAERFGESALAQIALCCNIVCGDALTGLDKNGRPIKFLAIE